MTVPNLFSGSATISYSLPKAGLVSLKLYDITGKLVRTLAEGRQPAGVSTCNLRAGNSGTDPDFVGRNRRDSSRSPSWISRGIYVLKLEAGGEALTELLSMLMEMFQFAERTAPWSLNLDAIAVLSAIDHVSGKFG